MEESNSKYIFIAVIGVFIVGAIFKIAQTFFMSILLSLFLSYLMDPLVVLGRKVGMPLGLSVTITLFVFLGVFVGTGSMVVRNLAEFNKNFPAYRAEFYSMIQDVLNQIESLSRNRIDVLLLEEIKKISISNLVISTATSLFSSLAQLLMVIFVAVLILLGKYKFFKKILTVFTKKRGRRIPNIMNHIDVHIRKYIGLKALISVIVAFASTIVLLLFKVQFALLWGVLTFLLNFIPYIGSITAIFLPVIFSLIQYGAFTIPIWIFICLFGLQQITGNFLEPKIMGDAFDLSLLVVFLSLLFWGWLWGPIGILLAVPMTNSVKIVLKNIPRTRQYAVLLERMRYRPETEKDS